MEQDYYKKERCLVEHGIRLGIPLIKGKIMTSFSELVNGGSGMIKGNESLVEHFNFCFLTPLSHNFKIINVDANPVTIGYLVTEL